MIKVLVAFSNNYVIGAENKLIWHLSNDLKRFKNFTTGNVIIMGRKTFESIGKALPNRETIVISRNPNIQLEGTFTVNSLDQAIDLAKNKFPDKEIFIVGGEQIYRLAMSLADCLEITQINHDFDGDAFFPEIDLKIWKEVHREKGIMDEKNSLEHYFIRYERIK
ncbi:MAG: hypothetical protein RIR51_407 [Bacteroidota bacterium]